MFLFYDDGTGTLLGHMFQVGGLLHRKQRGLSRTEVRQAGYLLTPS